MKKFAIILDFEATCDDKRVHEPQEIIEFPSVILSLETLEIIDEFESFVKPVVKPCLTDFCRNLTSIEQKDVDSADFFKDVFERHYNWLKEKGLNEENSVIITCGDWDLKIMLPDQCKTAGVEYIPPIYARWNNIKRLFCKVRGLRKAKGMPGMLDDLGLELKGHHHRGIDDCRNITDILIELVKKGGDVEPNAKLSVQKFPPLTLNLKFGERVEEIRLDYRNIQVLKKMAGKLFKKKVSGFVSAKGDEINHDKDLKYISPQEILELKYA